MNFTDWRGRVTFSLAAPAGPVVKAEDVHFRINFAGEWRCTAT